MSSLEANIKYEFKQESKVTAHQETFNTECIVSIIKASLCLLDRTEDDRNSITLVVQRNADPDT